MKNILKKKGVGFKKALSKTVVGVLAGLMLWSPIQAFAHNAYFIAITVDAGNLRYMGTVAYDDNDVVANNHKEAKIAGFYAEGIRKDTFSVPSVDLTKNGEENTGKYTSAGITSGDGDLGLIYTFPGIHTRGVIVNNDATNDDMDRAYWVSDTLIGQFNDALKFVMSNANYKPGDASNNDNAKQKFMQLGADLANKAHSAVGGGSQTLSFNNKSFTIAKAPSGISIANGLKASDYITITPSGGNAVAFVYRVEKGYFPGQALKDSVPEKVKSEVSKEDAQYLSWKHVALQGNYNYEVKGNSYSKITEIVKPGKLEQLLAEMLNGLLGGIRGLLGLYSWQELMLNQGVRSNSYYYGIMPKDWMNNAQTLHWVTQAIAWLLLIGALTKLLVQRNLASINSAMRVNLMEGIQNILLTGFLLTLIVPMFNALSSMNARLVDVFAQSTMWIDKFGHASSSSGLLGSIIVTIMYFFFLCYFNFVYIVRGITVALLYATAPLFIVSLAFGGKYKQMFGNWLKELISNIYMQSFHALCMAFFASVSFGGTARGIESIVIVYAFIPLTQFFRQNLMGLSGSTAEQIGGKALSAGTSVATGIIGGAMAGAKGAGAKTAGANTTSKTATANPNGVSNIQTKSSDALRNKVGTGTGVGAGTSSSSGIPEGSTGGISGVKGFNDANDQIPNFTSKPEMAKTNKELKAEAKEAFKNSATGIGVSSAGGALKGIGKATMGAGMILAGSATGNNALVGRGTLNMRDGMSGSMKATKDGFGGINSLKQAEAQTQREEAFGSGIERQQEGYMYSEDLGNGTIDHKHDAEGFAQDTGISNMVDTGKGMQYELSGKYDGDNFKFDDDNLNNSKEYENLNAMVKAWATNDKDAMAYYQKQGIQDVGINRENNNIVVSANKGNFGINKISKSGDSYIINKSNTAQFSNRSVYNVPKYEPQVQEENPQPNNDNKKNYNRKNYNNNSRQTSKQ